MLKVGQLVMWNMLYDVGMVKERGIGVIIDVISYRFSDYKMVTYKVLRNDYSDVMMFEEHAIEIFKE